MKNWARNYKTCVNCGTVASPHMARGLCSPCYQKQYQKNNSKKVANSKHRWYVRQPKTYGKQKREQFHFSGNRQACLERDNFRCVLCGSENKLIVHHRDHNGRGSSKPNNSLENLETLCRACHAAHHGTNTGWSRHHDSCISCGSTERKHNAKGLCTRCYSKV